MAQPGTRQGHHGHRRPALAYVCWALGYFLFQAPLWCGAITREGALCRNNSSGLLIGCHLREHKWQKLKMTFVPKAWRELNRGLWATPRGRSEYACRAWLGGLGSGSGGHDPCREALTREYRRARLRAPDRGSGEVGAAVRAGRAGPVPASNGGGAARAARAGRTGDARCGPFTAAHTWAGTRLTGSAVLPLPRSCYGSGKLGGGEELVEGCLILGLEPHFGEHAVAHMRDDGLPPFECAACALESLCHELDGVLIASQNVVALELRRRVEKRHLLLERCSDPVPPAIVTRERPVARNMHDRVLGVQGKEARKVTGTEQLVGLPHQGCVGMFRHDPPLPFPPLGTAPAAPRRLGGLADQAACMAQARRAESQGARVVPLRLQGVPTTTS